MKHRTTPRREKLADDRLRLALLKENFEYRELWSKQGASALEDIKRMVAEGGALYSGETPETCTLTSLRRFCEELEKSGIWDPPSLAAAPEDWLLILNVLNPYADEIPDPCPIIFKRPLPVCDVGPKGTCFDFPGWSVTPEEAAAEPSVRMLAIDLSCKKSEIMERVSHYIDHVKKLRANNGYGHRPLVENYAQWEPDNSRRREEAWQHLKVWKLRRQRMAFSDIARETGLSADNAKKSFYAAFELIEGHRYDGDKFREKYREIEAKGRRKPCDNCRACDPLLDALCPDLLDWLAEVEAYANQGGKNSSREKQLSVEMPEQAAHPCRHCPEKPLCDSPCPRLQDYEHRNTKTISTRAIKTSDDCPYCHRDIISGVSICPECGTAIPGRPA